MKKLLITGASGFLGWYLCRLAFSLGWQVHGTAHTKTHELDFVTWHQLDLTDQEAVSSMMNSLQPDAVIHAAAMGRPNDCQKNPEGSYAINVEATAGLAKLCQTLGCKLVFISTEQVFDGESPPYRESDPVSPINLYGEHKAIAEQKVLEASADNLVCRMPLMFGVVPSAPSFIQGWIIQLRQGKSLSLFTDEIRTPLGGEDAAKGIFMGLTKASGILHLAGPQSLSRLDMGRLLVKALGLDEDLICGCAQEDVKMAAPRPKDLTMSLEVAQSLGYAPSNMTDALSQALILP